MTPRTLNNQDGIALGPILFMIAILAILAALSRRIRRLHGEREQGERENNSRYVHPYSRYITRTGYEMILANEGNPFGMPITPNSRQGMALLLNN